MDEASGNEQLESQFREDVVQALMDRARNNGEWEGPAIQATPLEQREAFARVLYQEYLSYASKHTRFVAQDTFSTSTLDISQGTYSNLITRKRPPSLDTLDKLDDYFGKRGVDVYSIFGLRARMPSDPLIASIVRDARRLSPARQRELREKIQNMLEENGNDPRMKGELATN